MRPALVAFLVLSGHAVLLSYMALFTISKLLAECRWVCSCISVEQAGGNDNRSTNETIHVTAGIDNQRVSATQELQCCITSAAITSSGAWERLRISSYAVTKCLGVPRFEPCIGQNVLNLQQLAACGGGAARGAGAATVRRAHRDASQSGGGSRRLGRGGGSRFGRRLGAAAGGSGCGRRGAAAAAAAAGCRGCIDHSTACIGIGNHRTQLRMIACDIRAYKWHQAASCAFSGMGSTAEIH